MSAEEDTFEIDIYGDDGAEEQTQDELPETIAQPEALTQTNPTSNGVSAVAQQSNQIVAANLNQQGGQSQGVKRKHDEDEQLDHANEQQYHEDTRPVDPNATTALKVGDLHWWTTEEDLREFCALANAEQELYDLAFGEHKINGKSKGEAYLEFETPQAATATKREIERASQAKEASGLRKSPFTVFFTSVGNPHKSAAAGGAKKEWNGPQQNSGRGAYNNYNNNRGGYTGRGNYHNRGGYAGNNNTNNHMGQGRGNAQGGWGMNNSMGGAGNFGGFPVNPMMAQNFGNMGMPNFANMGRGGMMNNMGMMGRGGFGGMGGMAGMGGMDMSKMGMNAMFGAGGAGRGGGMMGAGGGQNWNNNNAGGGGGGGGFQQNGSFGGNGQQPNKRSKME